MLQYNPFLEKEKAIAMSLTFIVLVLNLAMVLALVTHQSPG